MSVIHFYSFLVLKARHSHTRQPLHAAATVVDWLCVFIPSLEIRMSPAHRLITILLAEAMGNSSSLSVKLSRVLTFGVAAVPTKHDCRLQLTPPLTRLTIDTVHVKVGYT